MIATFVLMLGMSYVFHGWLKKRGPMIEGDNRHED